MAQPFYDMAGMAIVLEEGVVQGQNANPPLIWEGRLVRLRTA